MYCSDCGTKNLENASFCSNCGRANTASLDTQSNQQAVAGTGNADIQAYYEAAIGPKNTDYYLSRFQRFDGSGAGVSWNWPAFFITFYWFLYRKMWGWAALYFFLPILPALLASLLFGNSESADSIFSLIFLVAIFSVIPMYANALYYRSIKKKIHQVTITSGDDQKKLLSLALKGGTSNVAIIILAVVVPIFVIGILAAIALPAYQDYIVRAKMSEPLAALAEAKTVVASYVAKNGRYPADFRSLNINTDTRPESDIIASLSLDNRVSGDTVRLVANVATCTWDGGECNNIDYKSFQLAGIINSDGTMSWECFPGDKDGANAVEIKYLPASCRN